MPVSAAKKIELKKEIKLLTKIAFKLLSDDKTLHIGNDESPRNYDKIWQKICISYIGKNDFNQATRIKKLWVNNTENFATEIAKLLKKVDISSNKKI